MQSSVQIERINEGALKESGALELVWRVFSEFEAPEYSAEGIREFQNFIEPESVANRLSYKKLLMWGCFDQFKIVGVIAARPPCHIALLFVDRDYHRQGIARVLFETVLEYYRSNSADREITVNSSPYAVEAYRRLGFAETDPEQMLNGIRFTPMKHKFR